MTGSEGPETLAQRLDHLFKTVRKADGGEYSYREVAEAISSTGEAISHSYVGHLRSGEKDNPTLRHLRALARFFGVPVEYFTNDRLAGQVDAELDLLAALRELKVQTVALRKTVLPDAEQSLQRLTQIVETIRSLGEASETQQPEPREDRSGRKRPDRRP